MKEFKQILLGNTDGAMWAASILTACLVIAAMYFTRVKKRDVSSLRTPYHWSWSFFWSDNFRRMVGTVILIILCIRIMQFWVKPDWTIYGAAIVGLISDQLAMIALRLKDAATDFVKGWISSAKTKADAFKVNNNDTPVVPITPPDQPADPSTNQPAEQ